MNRKEEMEALAENIALAIRIGGTITLYEKSGTLAEAALRASAAPEERISVDALRGTIANEWGSHLCYTDDTGYRRQCDPVGGRCRCADIARAIISTHALPSDSGKAAPDAWRDALEPFARAADGIEAANEYPVEDCHKVGCGITVGDLRKARAALAPATEIEALRAGLQLRIDQINPLVAALEKAREYVASFPYSAGSPAYLKQCSTLIEIDRALSSPSVGTPAQPSADRKAAT